MTRRLPMVVRGLRIVSITEPVLGDRRGLVSVTTA